MNDWGQTSVPSWLSGVTAIAAGQNHNVALKSNGTVVAWGYNFFGQIITPADLSGVTSISGGGNHTVALRSDGTVVAWGDNEYGQTSVPTNTYYSQASGNVTWDSATNSATFTPTQSLPAGVTLTFNVTSGVQSLGGAALSSSPSVSFTTLATDVCIAGFSLRCFGTLQNALAGALHGDAIKLQAKTITGNISHQNPVKVNLVGGYDATFSSRSGTSTISGTMTVGSGTMVADGIVIQ